MLKKIISVLLLAFSMIFTLLVQTSFAQSPTITPIVAPTPEPTPTPVTVTSDSLKNNKLIMFEEQSIDVTLSDNRLKLISIDTVVESKSKDAGAGVWTLTAKKSFASMPLSVRLKAVDDDGQEAVFANTNDKRFPLDIYRINIPTMVSLKVGEEKNISEIIGMDKNIVDGFLEVNPSDSRIITIADNKVSVQQAGGQPGLLVKPKFGSSSPQTVFFSATAKPSRIKLITNNYKAYVKTPLQFVAVAVDESGNLLPEDTKKIVWRVASTDSQYLSLRDTGNGEATIIPLKFNENPVFITAKIEGTNIEELKAPVLISNEQNIMGFSNIELRLNPMEDITAKDLFGSQAVKDYYVAKLRIFNKVPESQNGGPSSSILFFSEGLEINVSLLKRPLEKIKGVDKWDELDDDDVMFINNWEYIPFRDNPDIIKYVIKGEQPDSEMNINLDRLKFFYEKYCDEKRFSEEIEKESKKAIKEYRHLCSESSSRLRLSMRNWIPFRPYAFLIIASTHDRRSDRSSRSRLMQAANALSSFTSFATAFSRPVNNSGLVYGLDKYSNLLVPAFEKLFPSKREVQRKNIIDMVLQPLEDVPYGKEVNKIVFVPKKPITGVLPGYEVKISTMSVYKIKAEASVVQKQKIDNR